MLSFRHKREPRCAERERHYGSRPRPSFALHSLAPRLHGACMGMTVCSFAATESADPADSAAANSAAQKQFEVVSDATVAGVMRENASACAAAASQSRMICSQDRRMSGVRAATALRRASSAFSRQIRARLLHCRGPGSGQYPPQHSAEERGASGEADNISTPADLMGVRALL